MWKVTLASLAAGLAVTFFIVDRIAGSIPFGFLKAAHPAASIAATQSSLSERLAANGLELGSPVFVRIFKKSRELEVWIENDAGDFSLFETYPICAYSGGLGPKLREGDMQAPEGFYHVPASALLPTSRYHLAFNLGYPNAYDRSHGRTGSFLMVHGSCVSIGCYAMTDAGIEEIYALAEQALSAGQPFFRVHIFPFRMSDEALERYAEHEWHEFWANLKEGYDHFERTNRPPDVTVSDGKYTFTHS